MTQDDYNLWTGETVSFEAEDWTRIVSVASIRLASFLCLEELPTDDGRMPDALQMLLANFICATLRFSGNGEQSVASKSVRNFTISFNSDLASSAFEQVAQNYSDIIELYTECGSALSIEHTACDRCCGDW